MAADIVIPPAIEEVICEFDSASAPLDEHAVQQALNAACESLANSSDAENLGTWAEVLAFALVESRHHSSPWNTYFGPMGSGVQDDGTTVYIPDIAGADARVVVHWARRAKSIKHPVLKARYADLAWDMSRAIAKTRPDPDMARTAIDSYLKSLVENLCPDTHDQFEAALRALDLAVMIRDASRAEAARAALLKLHRGAIATGKGRWSIAFDRLIDDKRAGATDAEKDQLVADLEEIVTKCSSNSDPGVFDPHDTEDAARRLIKYYNKRGKGEDAKRLHEVIARASEHFASLSDAMLASSVLQTAVNAYRDAGLQKESRRVRMVMEEKIAESHDQMMPITTESTITKDDMELFLETVVVADLGTTFARIASEFLQKRRDVEKQVNDLMEQAPLMATISQSIVAENHVAAKVGSVEDDPFGRLIRQAAQGISFSDVWLIQALDRAIEVHNIEPGHFVSWAARTALFEDLTLLMEGVRAWYEQDFVKTVHVLVPQIEIGLRGIVSKLDKPVTKPHSTVAGVGVAIGMGDILYSKEITEALGPDLTLHFLALYADPRGFNLRNDMAHGLLRADGFHHPLASRIIHTLLVLGIWEQLAEARKAPENDD